MSPDGRTVYFMDGVRATTQLHALDVARNTVRQVTKELAQQQVNFDEDSGRYFINYADPKTPPTLYTAASLDQLGSRRSWKQVYDVNPELRALALGEERRSAGGRRTAAPWAASW